MDVTIMSGIPGSGKSTLARKLQSECGLELTTIVSADAYFERDGVYKFDPSKRTEAHAACFRAFLAAIRRDDGHVIVDNTNTEAWEIAPYYLAAQALGANVRIMRVTCGVNDAFARQVHDVPFLAFRALVDQFHAQDVKPWWNVAYVDQGPVGGSLTIPQPVATGWVTDSPERLRYLGFSRRDGTVRL